MYQLALHFNEGTRNENQTGIPFYLEDYLQLVDWTGRIIREDKRGAINQNLPPILDRLTIDPEHWLINSQHFEQQYSKCFLPRRKRLRLVTNSG